MSAPEVDRSPADASTRRRIRHEARDGLSVAILSLGASIGVTFALWVLLRFLG